MEKALNVQRCKVQSCTKGCLHLYIILFINELQRAKSICIQKRFAHRKFFIMNYVQSAKKLYINIYFLFKKVIKKEFYKGCRRIMGTTQNTTGSFMLLARVLYKFSGE